MADDIETGQYVVVLRARSSASFFPEEQIIVDKVPAGDGRVQVTLRTRYTDEGFEAPAPRELWLDIRGPADGLDAPIAAFSMAGRAFGNILALSANAPVDLLEAHIAYDDTTRRKERRFWEAFVPDKSGSAFCLAPRSIGAAWNREVETPDLGAPTPCPVWRTTFGRKPTAAGRSMHSATGLRHSRPTSSTSPYEG